MNSTMKCGGCSFNVNTDPCRCPMVPPEYPFNRPARDSYTFCCCGPNTPSTKNPITSAYPSAGPFKGSAFAMNNGNPFIMDSTNMTYGQVLVYSENVYTHVSQRDDLSCINLAARFDMTDTSLTNTVRNDFLKQYISRKYLELQGVLPIIKTTYKIRIHYTVRDIDGGTITQNHVDTDIKESNFHFTDINDRYVQSFKGLVVAQIPAITYQGLYNICIDRVELICQVIDTKSHLVDAMNPYYIFVNNNQEIQLQSATIEDCPPDSTFTIAECDVLKGFDYHANLTNRLRISFTAFTSIPIACGDTMGIWNALNEPTDAVISQLRNEVTALEDEVAALHRRDDEQQELIDNLTGQVDLNKNNIALLISRVDTLEADKANKDAIIADILARLEALEKIPLALVRYNAGTEFKRSQLTWKEYGNLYQATKDFTASGDFMQDVGLGNLVPVIKDASEYATLLERVNEVEVVANDASSDANEAVQSVTEMGTSVSNLSTTVGELSTTVETNTSDISTLSGYVSSMSETVSGLNTTVAEQGTQISSNTTAIGTLNETVETISTSVAAHSDAITANTTAIETNSGAISNLNTVVTALNEDVDDLDERVTDLEHPIDPEKINVRKVSDLSIRTFNNMTDAADYINADDAEDDEQYDLIIGPQMTNSTYTEYQRITSSKLRDVYNNGVNDDISPQTFYGSGLRHFYWGNMPSNATISIGQNAFSVCANMTSFEFPENVESISIGISILTGCSGLTSLTIPSSVKTIASGSQFGGCTSLTEVYIDSAYIAQAMFNGAYTVERVTIGPHVTEIHAQAFPSVPALTSITIPSNVTRINNQAFVGCTALETAVINISGDILQSAFAGCTSLENITLGEGVTEILDNAFSSSIATTIDIPSTVTSMSTNALAGAAFETINVHKAEGSISGAPWGATNATVNWLGE